MHSMEPVVSLAAVRRESQVGDLLLGCAVLLRVGHSVCGRAWKLTVRSGLLLNTCHSLRREACMKIA